MRNEDSLKLGAMECPYPPCGVDVSATDASKRVNVTYSSLTKHSSRILSQTLYHPWGYQTFASEVLDLIDALSSRVYQNRALHTIVACCDSREVTGEVEGFHSSPHPRPDTDACADLGESMRSLVYVDADAVSTQLAKGDGEHEPADSTATADMHGVSGGVPISCHHVHYCDPQCRLVGHVLLRVCDVQEGNARYRSRVYRSCIYISSHQCLLCCENRWLTA